MAIRAQKGDDEVLTFWSAVQCDGIPAALLERGRPIKVLFINLVLDELAVAPSTTSRSR